MFGKIDNRLLPLRRRFPLLTVMEENNVLFIDDLVVVIFFVEVVVTHAFVLLVVVGIVLSRVGIIFALVVGVDVLVLDVC